MFPASKGTLAAFPAWIRWILSSKVVVSSITGSKAPLDGPFVYALISSAETSLKHASLDRPAISPQPTALAKLLKEVNDAAEVGVVSGEAPEKIIAA